MIPAYKPQTAVDSFFCGRTELLPKGIPKEPAPRSTPDRRPDFDAGPPRIDCGTSYARAGP